MRTGTRAQAEKTEAVEALLQEGVPFNVACNVYRLARGMARRAELACSSEAADRDRVPCPNEFRNTDLNNEGVPVESCLCRDHGSFDDDTNEHGSIPRIAVQDARAERELRRTLAPYRIFPRFGGDPRGYVVKLKLPSGRSNTWGGAEAGWGIA